MKLAGFFLLVTGWLIVLSAIALLKSAPQAGFVFAGFAVQLLGLAQVIRSHLMPHGEKD